MMQGFWNALTVVAVVNLAYVVFALWPRNRVRRSVYDNLDSAMANGYFEPGEQLHDASPDEIAYDMTCYAPDFEGTSPVTIAPYVREWARGRWLETKGTRT